jgi:hypothetical protein
MNRFIQALGCCCLMLVGAIFGPDRSVAACFVCQDGYCVPAGAGQHGFRTCYGQAPEPECFVSTSCTGAIGAPLATTAALFSLEEIRRPVIARNRSSRVERIGAEFSCSRVAALLAGLAGTSPDKITLHDWRLTVSVANVPLRVVNATGDGYRFAGRSLAGKTRLEVSQTRANRAGRGLAAAELAATEVLFLPVVIQGKEYILALGSREIDPKAADFSATFVDLQQRFRADAVRYSAQSLLGMYVVGPTEGAAH